MKNLDLPFQLRMVLETALQLVAKWALQAVGGAEAIHIVVDFVGNTQTHEGSIAVGFEFKNAKDTSGLDKSPQPEGTSIPVSGPEAPRDNSQPKLNPDQVSGIVDDVILDSIMAAKGKAKLEAKSKKKKEGK